jgi:hypothetical protein
MTDSGFSVDFKAILVLIVKVPNTTIYRNEEEYNAEKK